MWLECDMFVGSEVEVVIMNGIEVIVKSNGNHWISLT